MPRPVSREGDALFRAPKRAYEAPKAGTGPSYNFAPALKSLSSTYTHQNKTRHAAQRGGGARADYMRRRRDELRKRPRHRCLLGRPEAGGLLSFKSIKVMIYSNCYTNGVNDTN